MAGAGPKKEIYSSILGFDDGGANILVKSYLISTNTKP